MDLPQWFQITERQLSFQRRNPICTELKKILKGLVLYYNMFINKKLLQQHKMQHTHCCYTIGITIRIRSFWKRLSFLCDYTKGIMNTENRGILVLNLRLHLVVSIWSIVFHLYQRKKSDQWTQLFNEYYITNVIETFLQNEWISVIHMQLQSFQSWKTKGKKWQK